MVDADDYGKYEGFSAMVQDDGSHRGRRLPIGALATVIGWSIALFIIGLAIGGPSLTLGLTTALPIVFIFVLSVHIQRVDRHTSEDRRYLWLFFLAIYTLGTGIFFFVELQFVEVRLVDEGQSVLVSGVEDVVWLPFLFLFIGVCLALFLLPGKLMTRGADPFLFIFIGLMILTLLVIPSPMTYTDDNIPVALQEESVFAEVFVFNIPYWQVYISRGDGGFLTFGIQLPVLMVGFLLAGLWLYLQPDQFRWAFGIKTPDVPDAPKDGDPPSQRPDLKVYKG